MMLAACGTGSKDGVAGPTGDSQAAAAPTGTAKALAEQTRWDWIPDPRTTSQNSHAFSTTYTGLITGIDVQVMAGGRLESVGHVTCNGGGTCTFPKTNFPRGCDRVDGVYVIITYNGGPPTRKNYYFYEC
jgi:hypothetical protein